VTNAKLNQMVLFCYMFTLIAFLGSLIPFAAPGVVTDLTTQGRARGEEQGLAPLVSPIAILRGCAWSTNAQAGSLQVPQEIACSPVAAEPASSNAANNAPAKETTAPAKETTAPAGAANTPAGQTNAPPGATNAPQATTNAPAGATNTPPAAAGRLATAPDNYQWVVSIGGVTRRWTLPDVSGQFMSPSGRGRNRSAFYRISGGVVVPLYVIIFALFGSAISMTRRVPEYQGRAMDLQDSFSNVDARRQLVFQIMQVLSAPLIATTAYYIIRPGDPVTSVAVAFGSGFSSEAILLMIRGAIEKLSPATTTAAAAAGVSVRIDPQSVDLDPAEMHQFAAKVLGSTNTQVVWDLNPPGADSGTISQSGLYYAPNFTAEKTITITAVSAADRTKSGSASVRLRARVILTPAAATVKPGNQQQFSAHAVGLTDPGVTWTTDAGSINTAGLFTAPPAPTVPAKPISITATSKADPTRSATATVTIA
jgi:hypothetical protein